MVAKWRSKFLHKKFRNNSKTLGISTFFCIFARRKKINSYMESKLQQLTEKLYQEGLSKGKAESEHLVQHAHHQAEKILEDARKQAAEILEQAEKSAQTTKRNAEAEIDLASRQTIARVKQTVENLIVAKTIETPVTKAFDDVSFVKDLIKIVIENMSKTGDLAVILPANKETELLSVIQNTMQNTFGHEVDVKFERGIKSGFRISTGKGGYLLTFTDTDFSELFKTHIRSKLVELLFGKQ
jgi:V/A-type H+-transporting ATPase subunit E